jgi:hypothetical protein
VHKLDVVPVSALTAALSAHVHLVHTFSSLAGHRTLLVVYAMSAMRLRRLIPLSRRDWELGGLAALEEEDRVEHARYMQGKAIREKIADPDWRPWRYVLNHLDFIDKLSQLTSTGNVPRQVVASDEELNVLCGLLSYAPRATRCFYVAEKKFGNLQRASVALGKRSNSIWMLRYRLWVQAGLTNHHRPIHSIRLRGSVLARLRSAYQGKRKLTHLRLQKVNLRT